MVADRSRTLLTFFYKSLMQLLATRALLAVEHERFTHDPDQEESDNHTYRKHDG
jgi:hypothetical protein